MQSTRHRWFSKPTTWLTVIGSGLIVCWIVYQLCLDLAELRAPSVLVVVDRNQSAANPVIKPSIHFQQKSGSASLDVLDSTLLQVLKHITASMQMELVVAPDIHPALQRKVSAQRIDQPLDALMSSLIPGIPYSVQSVQLNQGRELQLCIGNHACENSSTTTVEMKQGEPSYSEEVRESEIDNAIPVASEPGQTHQEGQYIPSRKQLRERFAYADVTTRLATLRQLDGLEQDTEFIVDVLYRDEDASVRQAAVRKLFFTQTEFVESALLNALSDDDETVVMLALNGLADFEDARVRQQASNRLANRNSTAIKLTMKILGIY